MAAATATKHGEIDTARSCFADMVSATKGKVSGFFGKAWKVAVDDPRKVVHGLKVGLALTLVSFFYYMRPLYDGVGGNAMWAIMTVVVVSEFTVGGALYKGLNRVFATSSAGFLALGVRWLASKSGDMGEPVILGISLFLIGSAATFSRFIPTIKVKFDYGVLIFILTYSLVSVSAYRVEKLAAMAEQRMSTIVIGCSICWTVIVFIRPVWAGGDLHRLVAANMEKLAGSIEGCTTEFFEDGADVDGKTSQRSQGYKGVLSSKASEDSLAILARWEPAHGRFGFRHPWHQYLKVTTAVRHCAYCVEALHACVNSRVQVPDITKKHIFNACMELSSQSSNILKELSNSIKTLTKSSKMDLLIEEMNSAVQNLQDDIATLPCHLVTPRPPPDSPSQGDAAANEEELPKLPMSTPLSVLLPIATVASMLIEIASRVGGVIEAANDLSRIAGFKAASDEKPKSPDIEGLKQLQMV